MQYKAIKIISGKEIIETGACETSAEKFIKEFGYYNEIEWTEEVENWIKENISDGLDWLIRKDFITENKTNIDVSKLMFFECSHVVHKLCRISTHHFQWCPITDQTHYYGDTKFNSKEDAVRYVETHSRFKIKTFDCVEDALSYYRGERPVENSKTVVGLETIKEMYDKIKDYDFAEDLCDAISNTEICNDIRCDDCPLKDYHL